jgi:hypothetical protein
MSEAELMGMDLECPDCGKKGQIQQVLVRNAVLQMIDASTWPGARDAGVSSRPKAVCRSGQ